MPRVRPADIGYITDLHLTVKKNPKWFAGSSFLGLQLERLHQFIKLCNEAGCRGILMGGDIFDDWDDFSMEMFADITDILEEFKGEWIRSVIGNHDILHSNKDSVRKSGIGAFKLWRPDFFSVYEDEKYHVHPIHWWHPFSKNILEQKTFRFKERDKIDIIAVHAQVGPYPTPHCVGIDEITIEGPDFVFFGDQHLGWRPKRKNHTWYINPGAFSNMTSDDLRRTPRCTMIREDEVWEYPLLPTPSAQIEAKKSLNQISNTVESIRSQEPLDFLEAVELVSKEKEYQPEVKEWLKEQIISRRSGT